MYTKLRSNRNSGSKKDTKGIEKNLHVVTGKSDTLCKLKKKTTPTLKGENMCNHIYVLNNYIGL